MYGVKSYVCSAIATSVRQTFLHTGHEIVISHWPSTWLPNNSSFLTTAWEHCGSKEGSKEALVSVLNYFICPVPSLLLADLFNLAGNKMEHCVKASPAVPLQGRGEPNQALCSQSFHYSYGSWQRCLSLAAKNWCKGSASSGLSLSSLHLWMFDRR